MPLAGLSGEVAVDGRSDRGVGRLRLMVGYLVRLLLTAG